MAMLWFLECVRYNFSYPAYRLGLRLAKRSKPMQLMRGSLRFKVSFHGHLNSQMKHAFWQVCSPGENMSVSFSEACRVFTAQPLAQVIGDIFPATHLKLPCCISSKCGLLQRCEIKCYLCRDPMRCCLIIWACCCELPFERWCLCWPKHPCVYGKWSLTLLDLFFQKKMWFEGI